MNLRPIQLVTLIVLALSSACSPAAATSPASTAAAQPSPKPPTHVPTDEPLDVAVPAVRYLGQTTEVFVVSSATGSVFQTFKPIALSELLGYAFSPDGRELTLVSNGELHRVDLASWKSSDTDVDLRGWISALLYSPDGKLIAMAEGAPEGEIRIVDAHTGEVLTRGQAGFAVRHIQFSSDEQAIMVYGPHVDANGISTGAPVAALLSTSNLSVLWSVELKGIREGAFPKEPGTIDIHQPGAAWYYQPAIAFAPDADVLYAVHGDEDKLTRIDFAARKTETIVVHQRLSWLERLLILGNGVAHAKGMDGTIKNAVISPDGKYLYAVSTTEAYNKNDTGMWDMKVSHGGLQVIDVADGSIVQQTDVDATAISLSPNGGQLYLTGWNMDASGGAWSEVYDLGFHKVLIHLDGIQLMPTRRLDGSRALVSIDYYNERLCRLASVDPAAWRIQSEWKGSCINWLIDPSMH